MIKKIVILISVIVAVIILIIAAIPTISNNMKFKKNKERVLKYLDEKYDTEFQLISTKIGKNAWPASRQGDEFIFYDPANEIYFQIICNEDSIVDYYDRALNGNEVSRKVRNQFVSEEFKYYIRCYGEKGTTYNAMSCQLFILADNKDDLSKAYEIISFMKEEFQDLNLKLVIAPYSQEKQIISLFAFKKNVSVNSIKSFYNKDITLKSSLFSTKEEFENLLIN